MKYAAMILLSLALLSGSVANEPTYTAAQLAASAEAGWNDGFAKGYDLGYDSAPPSCKRWI